MENIDFRLLVESSVDIICLVGLDLVMHYASPSCLHILGWTPEEMCGKGPDAFVFVDDLPLVAAANDRLVRYGVDLSPTTIRMLRKNGTYAWIEVVNACIPHDHEEGKVTGIVLGMRDITERKLREEKLEVLAIKNDLKLSKASSFDRILPYDGDGYADLLSPGAGTQLQSIQIPDHILASWQSIVDTMAEIFNVPAGLIMRIAGKEIKVFVSSQTSENPYHVGDSEHLLGSGLYCETVLKSKAELLIPDAPSDPKWKNNPDIKLNMVSYLGFPIYWPNKTPFGTICVLDCKDNSYSSAYKRLIQQFRDLIEHHLMLVYASSQREMEITQDRKRDQENLRSSEERFTKTFRLAPVPMMISIFGELRILDVNDAFTTTTGYTSEEVVGRRAAELNLLASPVRRQLEQILGKGNSFRSFEVQIRAKDGMLIDCLVSAERATVQGQHCVLSVFQDITERKRSEVELIAAIETVMQDTSWFSHTVIEKLAQLRQPNQTNKPKAELANLTPRELEVLELIGQGLSDGEVSHILKLSHNTVRNHVSTIYNKIGVHRRGAAIVWARERGIIGRKTSKGRGGLA
jgi:PAS domain S-box-containing protein